MLVFLVFIKKYNQMSQKRNGQCNASSSYSQNVATKITISKTYNSNNTKTKKKKPNTKASKLFIYNKYKARWAVCDFSTCDWLLF